MAENHDAFAHCSAHFVNWFRNASGTRLSSKVLLTDLRQRGAGRGVVASQDIQEDEELFAIPRSLVLTATTSDIPESALHGLEDLGSWPPLILAIISEYLKGTTSEWHPYFQVLPSSFDTLMFWTDDELKELQASAVVRKIGRASAEESWRETIVPNMLRHPALFPVKGADEQSKTQELIQLAHIAGSLIMAYAFDIDRDVQRTADADDDFEEDDEEEPLKGMVPFADMLNADADRNNARLFQEDDYLIMRSTQPIKSGEEIFNDYGPLPRSDLLRMYGYVTDNYAQYDVVEFDHELLVDAANMNLEPNNNAWLKREAQLEEIGILDDGYAFPRPSPGSTLDQAIPGDIHMLIRGLTLDPNATKLPKLENNDTLSIQEAALLSAVATKKLSEYPTSLDEDRGLLSTLASVTSLNRHRFTSACHVRIGEKEILRDLIGLCEAYIQQKTAEIAGNGILKRKPESDSSAMRPAKRGTRTNGLR